VFISYSRKDMAFADRLEAGLKARGFEPLIDRTDIYAFENWWERIETLIARADTVVFVISPDAVASDVALCEVSVAASLNKRFVPVVWRRVDKGNRKREDDSKALLSWIVAQGISTGVDRTREIGGFVVLPKPRGLAPGMRVKVLQSPLQAQIGMLAALRPHERVLVLLNLLGGQQRVELARSAIEAVE
jgi:TIR domain-containing protein